MLLIAVCICILNTLKLLCCVYLTLKLLCCVYLDDGDLNISNGMGVGANSLQISVMQVSI